MEYPNLTKQESAELQEYLSTHQDDLLTHIVQFNELMRKYQAATKEITTKLEILQEDFVAQNGAVFVNFHDAAEGQAIRPRIERANAVG